MNQNQNMQSQTGQGQAQQSTPAMQFGGPEMMKLHETLGAVSSTIEVYTFYQQYAQDQELISMMQRQKTFVTQMYNTILDTLKSAKDPAVPTQSYEMQENNQTTFGMTPSTPKTPATSFSELGDAGVSGAVLGHLKGIATHFTTTALESCHPVMRRILADSVPNVIELAFEMYLYQNKHQYYQVPQFPQQDMQAIMNSHAPVSGNITH